MLFARKDKKNQKLVDMSMKIIDAILLSQFSSLLMAYLPMAMDPGLDEGPLVTQKSQQKTTERP